MINDGDLFSVKKVNRKKKRISLYVRSVLTFLRIVITKT